MKRAALLSLVLARGAAAEPGDLALGLVVGVPGQGSGAPIGAMHVPGGITARYELAPWRFATPAISGGLGVPIASVGASAWCGLELRRALRDHFAVYTTPGLRTGFVGPGYYARHSDVFVGFAYIYSGPWTVAPRLPLGVAASFGRVDAYVEVLAEAPLWPTPELLLGGGAGVRVRL